MEQQYRDAEGQLEFPFDPPRPSVWRYVPIAVLIVVFAMMALPSFAQEPRVMILTKGVLCQSEDDAKTQVDIYSSADTNISATPTIIEGCHIITDPVPAVITPIGVYENKHVVVLLGVFHIPDMPPQYGYLAWKPNDKGI